MTRDGAARLVAVTLPAGLLVVLLGCAAKPVKVDLGAKPSAAEAQRELTPTSSFDIAASHFNWPSVEPVWSALVDALRAWIANLSETDAKTLVDTGSLAIPWNDMTKAYPTHAQRLHQALGDFLAAAESPGWKGATVSVDSFKVTRYAPGGYELSFGANYQSPNRFGGVSDKHVKLSTTVSAQ